jgi:glycerol uptake facilitator protein
MLFDIVELYSEKLAPREVRSSPPGTAQRLRRRANRMAAAAAPSTTQKLFAELAGTACLVYVGAGSAAATGVIAAGTKVPFSMAQLGMISFAFMLVIVGVVYAIGHISGGHINPAVTLSLAVSGKFPWREVPGYMAAQLAGAVIGALGIFVTLGKAATVAAGGGVTAYNPATTGFGRGLLIEAIGTAILVFVIFGVIDHRAVPGWAPMAIGSIVFAVIIIVGPATGAAINPARYLGTFLMQGAFGGTVSWAQVPAYLIGELAGGVLGGLAYVGLARSRAQAELTGLAPADSDTAVSAAASADGAVKIGESLS